MKSIEIKDKKILDTLKNKEAITARQLEVIKEMERLEKEYNSNMSKAQMIDDKARPMILKEVSKVVLTEWEELSRVHVVNGKWYMEFTDRLEEFKTAFKKKGQPSKEELTEK